VIKSMSLLTLLIAGAAGFAAPGVEGQLTVPANRTSGPGQALTLRFVRFASTATSPGAPIVFLAGGPGDSGIRAIKGMPPEILNELLSIADVVAIDQRGTGSSEPLNAICPPGAMLPRDSPANPQRMLEGLRERVQRCLIHAAENGIDAAGLTTAESADDLEALRKVLGARRLTLLAGSYGTHLALAAARRHPDLVDRMALAGVEGPDDTLKLPSRVDEVLRRIPALLDGDYSTLGRWALTYRVPRPLNLMNLAMDCASYGSRERLARIEAEAKTATLGNAINFPLPDLCDLPGLPRLPASDRTPVESRVPALLISGTFDGRTPVQNAVDVARHLANAETLVIDGASHGLFREARTMQSIMAFFRR